MANDARIASLQEEIETLRGQNARLRKQVRDTEQANLRLRALNMHALNVMTAVYNHVDADRSNR